MMISFLLVTSVASHLFSVSVSPGGVVKSSFEQSASGGDACEASDCGATHYLVHDGQECTGESCTEAECCAARGACTESLCDTATQFPNFVNCASASCQQSECCVERGVCTESLCSGSHHHLAHPGKHCAGATCEESECCAVSDTCSAAYCDDQHYLTNDGQHCAGGTCTQEECCTVRPGVCKYNGYAAISNGGNGCMCGGQVCADGKYCSEFGGCSASQGEGSGSVSQGTADQPTGHVQEQRTDDLALVYKYAASPMGQACPLDYNEDFVDANECEHAIATLSEKGTTGAGQLIQYVTKESENGWDDAFPRQCFYHMHKGGGLHWGGSGVAASGAVTRPDVYSICKGYREVNCVYGEWTAWTTCTKTCGEGTTTRTKPVEREEVHGGIACDDPSHVDYHTGEHKISDGVEQKTCEIIKCPIDCELGPWAPWQPCNVDCGGGERVTTRPITQDPLHLGAACEATEKTEECNMQPCPIHCVLSEWTDFTECDAPCGPGTKHKTREVQEEGEHGGLLCANRTDGGYLVHEDSCQIKYCPINCEWADWNAWADCSLTCGTGTQSRDRGHAVEMQYEGDICPEAEREMSRSCNPQACPIDCVLGEWTAWGECSLTCGGGSYTRTKPVTTQPDHGGVACGDSTMDGDCNTQACPIDCAWGAWTEWTDCSTTCGAGTSSKSRQVATQSDHGGAACAGDATAEQACNLLDCPIHCVAGPWSEWTSCSLTCGGGTSIRNANRTTDAAHNGIDCTADELGENMDCNVDACPVDCVYSDWNEWGTCDKDCGGGNRQRTKDIAVPMQHNGVECVAADGIANQDCNTHHCPIDCVMGEWSAFSECSTTCNAGITFKTRSPDVHAQHNGTVCTGELHHEEACFETPCPVHCVYGDWMPWTRCSADCGGGARVRTKHRTVLAAHGGENCVDSEGQIIETCNTEACPEGYLPSEGNAASCDAARLEMQNAALSQLPGLSALMTDLQDSCSTENENGAGASGLIQKHASHKMTDAKHRRMMEAHAELEKAIMRMALAQKLVTHH